MDVNFSQASWLSKCNKSNAVSEVNLCWKLSVELHMFFNCVLPFLSVQHPVVVFFHFRFGLTIGRPSSFDSNLFVAVAWQGRVAFGLLAFPSCLTRAVMDRWGAIGPLDIRPGCEARSSCTEGGHGGWLAFSQWSWSIARMWNATVIRMLRLGTCGWNRVNRTRWI